ncbi:hypothetical protein [Sorangium sp. So ce233]|uniref:hypothetical protein n=1 Tax=Sorangium sp. So ce233 TaxID=3133290 RepID=UPI003F62B327
MPRPLRVAEAADRIALHLGRIVQRAIAGVPDKERVSVGLPGDLFASFAAAVA